MTPRRLRLLGVCALFVFAAPLAAQDARSWAEPRAIAWSTSDGGHSADWADLTWTSELPPPPPIPLNRAVVELWRAEDDENAAPQEPDAGQRPQPAVYRLPGEFERQGTIFFGCGELAVFYPEVLADLVEAVRHRVDVAALVPDDEGRDAVADILSTRGLPADAVRYVEVPHDTMWVRDYGPLFVRRTGDGGAVVVDADYERFSRPKDDQAPRAVAAQLQVPSVNVPLSMEGGNLLSNGRGLCLTTTTLLERNLERGYQEDDVRHLLREFFGAEETVFLEPLSGEPTGHVDMFAAFTDANTVVVGEYDFLTDPVNAAILDRNAARLAQTQGPNGPLKVVRIPMPPRDGEQWRTYTNVIFANGLLLTPEYDRPNSAGQREAIHAYRRLLPGWRVAGVDVSGLIANGGALHCISMNAPRLARWPTFEGKPRPLTNAPFDPIAARNSMWRDAANRP